MRTVSGRPSSIVHRLRTLMWSVPLGWQLCTLYTLLLVVTLSLVGSVVYSQQESFLVQDVAQRLEQEAARIVALPSPPSQPPRNDTGRPDQPELSGAFSSEAERHMVQNLVRGLSGPNVTVAVLDAQGAVITSTQPLEGGDAPVVDPVTPLQRADALTSGQPLQWIAERSNGGRQVVVLMSVTVRPPDSTSTTQATLSEPVTLLVEQSASLAATDAALERLRTYLLLGVLGGTLAGVVLVLFFTRSVLRSLDRVADTADAIASGDLQRRLQLPAGRNEVARLGKAFDYMVGRLVTTLEAQRRFIADASHELRTPLTSLKGLAEILVIGAHGNDSRVVEQSAQAINGELDRLIRLVTDLLTLSRLNSPADITVPSARPSRMDVCTTIGAAATQMARQAEARDITLRQECAGPVWIVGDAGRMKQVLLNLLDNALRYTPMGGQVTLRAVSEGSSARIEVADTGSGIDERDLPHIFERFYRGDTSRSRSTGNSGLGLAIVQEIVQAHGGTIEVKSTLRAGTCFTIHLPLARTHSPERQSVEVAADR
jgi:signal transduction histidine kinase